MLEIPEIASGLVEIKAIAREAGYRSKVAVSARQPGIDPVGCCVGLRGIRIQNIVNELSGEKIDVVQWSEDPRVLIANALSPATVLSVSVNEAETTALVKVPDKQLSLAIGKEGQNVRLAAKLTGWRIDIKSASELETEKTVVGPGQAAKPVMAEEEETAEAPPVSGTEEVVPVVAEESPEAIPAAVGTAQQTESAGIEVLMSAEISTPPAPSRIRFAEDIMPQREGKSPKKDISKKDEGRNDGMKTKKTKPKKKPEYYEDEDFEN